MIPAQQRMHESTAETADMPAALVGQGDASQTPEHEQHEGVAE